MSLWFEELSISMATRSEYIIFGTTPHCLVVENYDFVRCIFGC